MIIRKSLSFQISTKKKGEDWKPKLKKDYYYNKPKSVNALNIPDFTWSKIGFSSGLEAGAEKIWLSKDDQYTVCWTNYTLDYNDKQKYNSNALDLSANKAQLNKEAVL